MRRYWIKVKVCGVWIPGESAVDGVAYYYASLDEAKVVESMLRDLGYEVRIDVR